MAKRRVALLIATDSYADENFTDLRTPCHDATALAQLLGDPKIGAFDVRTLTNRPAQEVRQVLDETFTDADRDDLVLLHISGHGLKDSSGRLHLIMSDTSRKHLRASAIAATWLRELIDHSRARRVVVWLDCCFSGAFPSAMTAKGTETVDAIDQLTGGSGRGCAVMTASTKIQYAFEKDQASVFTEAIMAGLRGGAADLNEDGFVDASELYSYAYEWVRARTPEQTPTRNDVLAGDIRIAYNPHALRLPLELAPEIRSLLRSTDQRFRQLGLAELNALAERGDQVAIAALAALGQQPVQEPPARHRRAVVVDLPRPLSEALKPTGFTFTHQIRAKSTCLTGAAFDPAHPHRLCVGETGMLQWLDVRNGVTAAPIGWQETNARQIDALAFSPDGELLAIGGANGVILFDRPFYQRVPGPFDEHRWTSDLAFSPDGSLLAGAGVDNVVHVWKLRDNEPSKQLVADDRVLSVAFSPDGRTLATSVVDMTIHLWDVASGERVRTLRSHPSVAQSIAFSPDGGLLVIGGQEGAVRTIDLDGSGRASATMRVHQSRVVSVAFGPDGVLATVEQDGRIDLWQPS